jgi:hypothetical protein
LLDLSHKQKFKPKTKKPNKMSFNKRILKKENILCNLNNLFTYLNADAVICTDDFSCKVYRMYEEGFTEEEIINIINKMK